MANSTEAEFEQWLGTLPSLGYDRHWVNRNMPSLRKRFDETGGAQMTPCPPASSRARDRYEEI